MKLFLKIWLKYATLMALKVSYRKFLKGSVISLQILPSLLSISKTSHIEIPGAP